MRRTTVAALAFALGLGLAAAGSAAEEHDTTVTGEVVDTYCFASMGAKGESHKACGQTCAKKGIPVGLLENGTNKLYVLLPNKDKGTIPDEIINKMGDTVTVTGKAYTAGGSEFLTIGSVK